MFRFAFDAALCVSCAICVDACEPHALALRFFRGTAVEGLMRSCADEALISGTFAYPADMASCDGCEQCVRECPVEAVTIELADSRRSVA